MVVVCEWAELCVEAKYTDAIHWYDKAIELDGSNAIYYANRAFAHIKMEKLGAAIADATQAIELNPKYVKVGHRIVCSLAKIGLVRDITEEEMRSLHWVISRKP